jgi:hypothetical protein
MGAGSLAPYTLQAHVSPDFQRTYPVAIYQQGDHRGLTDGAQWQSFFYTRADAKKIFAEVHFTIVDGHAVSRPGAPFGSIAFDASLPVAALQRFIAAVDNQLIQLGCHAVTLVHPPAPYQRHTDLLLTLLQEAKYGATAELASVLSITQGGFGTGLNAWENRKLAQAREAGLHCSKLSNERVGEVYDFLHHCRAERGYSLSLTREQTLHLADASPNAIQLFIATQNNEWVAAVLAIQDHPEIVYTFYYGHAAAADKLSPMVLLMEFVYESCQAAGMHYLNLGTSTLQGTTNVPLLQFKLHLGAMPMQKVTLTKRLS